jgi:probable HAF family extracellular repeat protein
MFNAKRASVVTTTFAYILTAGCGGATGLQPSSPLASNPNATVNGEGSSLGLYPLVADEKQRAHPTNYVIEDLGTLGGTYSIAVQLSNSGFVTGISNLPGDTAQHAFLWRKGLMTDLGTLGGPSSGEGEPANENGDVAVFAQTSNQDPLGEDFCFDIPFPSHLTCLPFVWRNGVKIVLPTLGGYNAAGGWINNRGEVAGVAENTTPNRTCGPNQVLHSKPVVWQLGQPVRIREIPTLPRDTDGIAVAINDHDQIAAFSGRCSLESVPIHGYFWQNGTLTNMGALGGTQSLPQAINNKGEVVGVANVRGDKFAHAFFWKRGRGMADLGTLEGDVMSAAYGINEHMQIVGESDDANGKQRPYIWQNGVMTDLNTLIPATSPLFLLVATGINNREEISGFGLQTTTGEIHPFLAIPSNSSIQRPARVSRPRLSARLREFLRGFEHNRMRFFTHG